MIVVLAPYDGSFTIFFIQHKGCPMNVIARGAEPPHSKNKGGSSPPCPPYFLAPDLRLCNSGNGDYYAQVQDMTAKLDHLQGLHRPNTKRSQVQSLLCLEYGTHWGQPLPALLSIVEKYHSSFLSEVPLQLVYNITSSCSDCYHCVASNIYKR